jgi:hypothetical protein
MDIPPGYYRGAQAVPEHFANFNLKNLIYLNLFGCPLSGFIFSSYFSPISSAPKLICHYSEKIPCRAEEIWRGNPSVQ